MQGVGRRSVADAPGLSAYLALCAICFFWGTTYVAIRMALEVFNATTLVCVRFVLSGSILLLVAILRRMELPKGRELWITARNGILILGIGNGAIVYSEIWIPSSLAALFMTTFPFWMVGVEALFPTGDPMARSAVFGMLLGLGGALLLIAPEASAHGFGSNTIRAFVLLQAAWLSWAVGSISQRHRPSTVHAAVSGAVQQLSAGLAYLIPALLISGNSSTWSLRATTALFYLVIFGSIVGYTSYLYALARLPVALVSLYTYVNPIVAILMGWFFYREHVGWRQVAAMIVILCGVALVKRHTTTTGGSKS